MLMFIFLWEKTKQWTDCFSQEKKEVTDWLQETKEDFMFSI